MSFSNVYDDDQRALAYSTLEFPGTYYLAFRDLPDIFARHVRGRLALDFGCGAGRSTRLLRRLGFEAVGVDISASMIAAARSADTNGQYHLIADGDFSVVQGRGFDLVFSAFAFDNIPGVEWRITLMSRLAGLLNDGGRIVVLGSTPEIYTHEWASFTTKDFPRNWEAKSGETVQIVMKDVPDARPVVDLAWFHDDYIRLFGSSGLQIMEHCLPLGHPDEPYGWISETRVAPWMIYVVGKKSPS